MKLHLAHLTEGAKTNWMHGYRDAIGAIQWALQDLGHDVTYGFNKLSPDRRTILFGGHLIPQQFYPKLRPDTVFYNLGRITGPNHDALRSLYSTLSGRFELWDCEADGAAAIPGVRFVPLGYAPVLRRLVQPKEQDIDAVLVGAPTTLRLKLFQTLVMYKSRCVFAHGLFGALRDELISRSKVVLAIVDDRSHAAPSVRFSLPLANSKAVVSTLVRGSRTTQSLRDAVIEVEEEHVLGAVQHLVANIAARRSLEERAFALFRQHDARPALTAALGG
ncbi:hypothetical protein [Devosia sp.]|uniref:hypothetical protein n=1 Tax=Devosia sp. TaxID=1871048 RepID=UPI003BA9015E